MIDRRLSTALAGTLILVWSFAMACAQLQTISERRVEQLVNPSLSGLPPFLAKNSGLKSGFMIAPGTAENTRDAWAIVPEAKTR